MGSIRAIARRCVGGVVGIGLVLLLVACAQKGGAQPEPPPREGGAPTVAKLISGPRRVMKRLKRREREVCVQLNEGGAQLRIRQPHRDERADLFVRGLQST